MVYAEPTPNIVAEIAIQIAINLEIIQVNKPNLFFIFSNQQHWSYMLKRNIIIFRKLLTCEMFSSSYACIYL